MSKTMEIEPIERVEWLLGQLDKLSLELRELRVAAERLPHAERDFESVKTKVLDELRKLDLTESKNTGWESRLIAFLVQIHRTTARKTSDN